MVWSGLASLASPLTSRNTNSCKGWPLPKRKPFGKHRPDLLPRHLGPRRAFARTYIHNSHDNGTYVRSPRGLTWRFLIDHDDTGFVSRLDSIPKNKAVDTRSTYSWHVGTSVDGWRESRACRGSEVGIQIKNCKQASFSYKPELATCKPKTFRIRSWYMFEDVETDFLRW